MLFITLTALGKRGAALRVNMGQVIVYERRKPSAFDTPENTPADGSELYLSDGNSIRVAERPEQIDRLIRDAQRDAIAEARS